MVVSESSARKYALDPEVRLMLEVRDDNAAAFEELVLRYQARLVTILRHLVGDADQAEDLAQEVFMRVYRSRKSYEPGAKFATWLFTIAKHVAANALRTRSRRPEIMPAPLDSGAMGVTPLDVMLQASSGLMPVRQLAKAEIRDVVRVAVESLGERQRLAVLLNKFENMSYADIADTMKLSTQAVKSLLSRARVNLHQVLEPYFERGERPTPDGIDNSQENKTQK
ncbi:MAG: sigma-70 family RNA polymerase sigma factor [Thermoguttaceae bacterium]